MELKLPLECGLGLGSKLDLGLHLALALGLSFELQLGLALGFELNVAFALGLSISQGAAIGTGLGLRAAFYKRAAIGVKAKCGVCLRPGLGIGSEAARLWGWHEMKCGTVSVSEHGVRWRSGSA